jgi:hypothetical protein
MKTFLLVVYFFTADGQSVIVDGWHPLPLPSIERCLAGKQNIKNYLDQTGLPDRYIGYAVGCIEEEI